MAITGLSNQRYALIDPDTGFYGENKPFTKAITSSFEPDTQKARSMQITLESSTQKNLSAAA